MRCEIVSALGADPGVVAADVRALVAAPESVAPAVSEIIAAVRTGGDAAVAAFTRRFDTGGAPAPPLRVSPAELDAAVSELPDPIRAGLELAIENVERVGAAAVRGDRAVVFDDHEVVLRSAPVGSAAVYVPGGRAPYPSTVVMGVVTARVAEVEEVAVCAPPGRDGELDPVVLAACRLAGASTVYRMGGAQAVAALAYGTESVAAVDVIVGPGNHYVQEAKRQVSGAVGIDGFAGPSDLVVVADARVEVEPLALDLLAQAEHGPGSLVVAVSPSAALLEALARRLEAGPETGAVARAVRVGDLREALAVAQALAPEHLELIGPESEALAPACTRAGCVFVGATAATAFGDYIVGSNHILPTNGAARFASALSVAQFRRAFTEVRIRDAAALARAEGFEIHARSIEARIRDNG